MSKFLLCLVTFIMTGKILEGQADWLERYLIVNSEIQNYEEEKDEDEEDEEYGADMSHNRCLSQSVILSLARGFYMPNGVQLIGRFYHLASCMRSCATSSTCFAGDYDPFVRRCYHHSAITTCSAYRSHPMLTHFSKVPCRITDAPNGRVALGVSMAGGRVERGVYSLQECLKRCATGTGGTREATVVNMAASGSECMALDFDFSTCRCHLFVSNALLHCPVTSDNAPANLRHNPSSIRISFCPAATTTTKTTTTTTTGPTSTIRVDGTTKIIIG